jgi:hypothetical protein
LGFCQENLELSKLVVVKQLNQPIEMWGFYQLTAESSTNKDMECLPTKIWTSPRFLLGLEAAGMVVEQKKARKYREFTS